MDPVNPPMIDDYTQLGKKERHVIHDIYYDFEQMITQTLIKSVNCNAFCMWSVGNFSSWHL